MPRSVLTLCFPRAFNRQTRVLQLRVNVAFRRCHIAVVGEVGERPRVDVRSPAGQTGVAERIQRKVAELPERARLRVLPGDARRLDMSAFRWSREDPFSRECFAPQA